MRACEDGDGDQEEGGDGDQEEGGDGDQEGGGTRDALHLLTLHLRTCKYLGKGVSVNTRKIPREGRVR